MKSLLSSTLLVAIALTGSGCKEQPQEPAAPPAEPGPPAPDGAGPGDYPPPGDGAGLMPQPGGIPAAQVADRGLSNAPPMADGEANPAFGSGGPLARQPASVEEELTGELINTDPQVAPPGLEESQQLELDAPIDFGESSPDWGDLGGRYDDSASGVVVEEATEQ